MIVLAGPVYNDGTGKGDIVTMFPAIVELGQIERVHVAIQDDAVRALLPLCSRVALIDDMKGHIRSETLVRLDVHAAVAKYGKAMHPTQMFFAQAGLQVPAEVPRPNVNVVPSCHPFDYVLAPFTNDHERRGWDYAKWFALVAHLARDGTVCVVGAEYDRMVASGIADRKATIIVGAPLPSIAGLFQSARCVITVDSMANRLAHAVRARHLLLHGQDATPFAWAFGDEPGRFGITKPSMADITVDEVALAVKIIHHGALS